MALFRKNDIINGFTVVFPIKEGSYAETYRVKGLDGKLRFLKLIDKAKLQPSQIDENGKVIEIEISKQLNHHNLCSFIEEGALKREGREFVYFVTEFVSGETVAQRMAREKRCAVSDVKRIALAALEALKYLHSLPQPVLHNEVTMQNLMLDMNGELNDLKLIDFGHAQLLEQAATRPKGSDWDLFYLAPERFNGVACVQSDLYSVGCLIYHLLFGEKPWFVDLTRYDAAYKIEVLLEERQKPLKMPNMDLRDLDEQFLDVIVKATSQNIDQRFQTADEFIGAITGKSVETSQQDEEKEAASKAKKGNGFDDVAGMEDLKAKMRVEIIKVLKDPEKAKKFGITVPNGILLYGPPGCGKTFFAEKLAEEIGCNYMYAKCSDVASPYIHGGQEKIAALFEEARKNAPTLLFLDEVEAMIMDRSKQNNSSMSGEVNEFLAQLNNCGEDRVTVIAATNKPDLIDEAALRSGRLALHYYIPQPNYETRRQLFKVNLKKRSAAENIDYDKLASMTENYSCADIKEIVDNAGRYAFGNDCECITQEMLETAAVNLSSHLSMDVIKKHEAIRDRFESQDKKQEWAPIGFRK